ncbi:MAG TPA: tyrosine-type recombinase/integrase, partial [Actinomycetes bacterium]|nr:tyrosine-type recombinase/integrase [Actinomycetes bacterium]
RIEKLKVSKRGKPYQVCWSWTDATGKRRFKKERFAKLDQAKAKQREVEQAVADANLPDYKAMRTSFEEWAERWFESKVATSKPSTARGYRSLLDSSVLPEFGSRRIRAITPGDVDEWIAKLIGRGLTPPTIKHHHGVARAVFAFAARHRAIAYNPARDVALPTDRSMGRLKPEPRFLTASEVETVSVHLDAQPPYGLLTRFAAYTGLRAGEIAGLNVADVDLLRREVTVRRTRYKVRDGWQEHTPKSGLARKVPLPKWLADDLGAYLATHPRCAEPGAPLWPGRRKGGYTHGERGSKVEGSAAHGDLTWDQAWERDTFTRRYFAPALRAAGLPVGSPGGVRFHDLRHSYASLCASAGIPAYRIAKRMGHASEIVTRSIYTHLFAEDSASDMEALARPSSENLGKVVPIPSAKV